MAIDDKTYHQPAIRGDVSGAVIDIVAALDAVAGALTKIRDGAAADVDVEINRIRTVSDSLLVTFDELTGWDADGS